MIKIILLFLFASFVHNDCPLIPYPRQLTYGFINAELNGDPQLHNSPQQYTYPLQQLLQQTGISVAIGVIGFQLNTRGQLNFFIEHMPSTLLNALKFRIQVNDQQNGWRNLKFNFIASQSPLFQVSMQIVNQFSGGVQNGKYSVYRPILNFNNFQSDPIIRIFMHGLQIKSKPLDDDYNQMAKQYQGFRRFSSNTQLVTYFSQALQQKKSIFFRTYGVKLLGRLLSFSIQTNTDLRNLRFSYLIFSRISVAQKHNYILGDFYLINGNQQRISSLQNMGMLMVGLSGFKVSRDQSYNFNLNIENFMGQTYFNVQTNYKYLPVQFTYIAYEMQQKFVCETCINSSNIFQNKYCVQICPRGYSRTARLDNFYCQKCQIQKLKVVDPNTGDCSCAKRHYLQAYQDTCKPCTYDCMTCSVQSSCLTCDNNLLQTKRRINSVGRCQCPITGYYDDKAAEDIVCQKCDNRCLTCNGPRSHDCLSCLSSKQLDSLGFCTCKNGYVEDASGNCVCTPPRILFNSICLDLQTRCNQNQIQQYVQLSRRCICKPDFIQVGDNCIKCGRDSIFDNNQLRCKCTRGTIYVNGQCVPCGYNQVFDQFSNICVCRPGTFKSEDGSCISCPVKMAYINGRCQCIFNYFERSPGVCERCVLETDGPKCRKNTF